MKSIEEIPTAPLFSRHIAGATAPKGWFLKCISGDEGYGVTQAEWIARFVEYAENDYGFTFGPDISFAVYWKTEAEAIDVCDKLRRVGVSTEIVKVD
jgi:hypothetical protein